MIARFNDHAAPADARLLTLQCSAMQALAILADIDHYYVSPAARPRVGAAVLRDGAIELWIWPRIAHVSALLLFLLRVGRPVWKPAIIQGNVWITGDRLGPMLAALAQLHPEEAAHV